MFYGVPVYTCSTELFLHYGSSIFGVIEITTIYLLLNDRTKEFNAKLNSFTFKIICWKWKAGGWYFSHCEKFFKQREKGMVPENSSMAPEKLTSLKLFIDYSASYRENPDQLHVLVTLAANQYWCSQKRSSWLQACDPNKNQQLAAANLKKKTKQIKNKLP